MTTDKDKQRALEALRVLEEGIWGSDINIDGNEIVGLIETISAALSPEPQIDGPIVYTEEERDGMAAAFEKAQTKHGYYESLFAVASYILRKRNLLRTQAPVEGE